MRARHHHITVRFCLSVEEPLDARCGTTHRRIFSLSNERGTRCPIGCYLVIQAGRILLGTHRRLETVRALILFQVKYSNQFRFCTGNNSQRVSSHTTRCPRLLARYSSSYERKTGHYYLQYSPQAIFAPLDFPLNAGCLPSIYRRRHASWLVVSKLTVYYRNNRYL